MVEATTPVHLNPHIVSAVATPTVPKSEKIQPAAPPQKPSENNQSHDNATRDLASYFERNDLRIQIDKEAGRTYFQIVSKEGKVLLQVPPEEILNMARKFKEEQRKEGLLLDKEG